MPVTQSLIHQLEHHGSYYTLHLRTTTQGLLFKYTVLFPRAITVVHPSVFLMLWLMVAIALK